MARFTRAHIDLDALQHNFSLARELAGGARVVAIVKANAYGHGAVQVARSLPGADMFGVACIEEGLELVECGIRQPVLLLEGFFEASELPEIDRVGFEVVIHTDSQLECLLAAKLKKPLTVWLKHDSGMHRLGFSDQDFRQAYQRLQDSANVADIRLMSHFASADELNSAFTVDQVSRFDCACEGLTGATSLANSAGLLAWPQACRDWVRPGLMLYGCSPFDQQHETAARLQPVMTLRSHILAVRDLPPGEAVGYGQTWRAEQNVRVGTVAIGYGDGYPRHATTGTPVLVNGQRTRLLGTVSMDMLTVDLTDLPHAGIGDPVILWGNGLSANEIAVCANTIPWTLVTGMTRRVPRIYTNGH